MQVGSVFVSASGLAIFDPLYLNDFLSGHAITQKNLYEFFTTSDLGDDVLLEGVLLPIYPINANDYKIIINMNEKFVVNDPVFKKGPYRLCVISNTICISDFSIVEDWNYDETVSGNDEIINPEFVMFAHMENGKYEFYINGFENKNGVGYELIFSAVEEFSKENTLDYKFNI